jgi:hypothetical protein
MIGKVGNVVAGSGGGGPGGGGGGGGGGNPPPRRPAPKAKGQKRRHDTQGGRYQTNRAGHSICRDYQSGRCASVRGMWCGKPGAQDVAHLCDLCLGQHPSSECTHSQIPDTGISRKVKGKGKGGGGGGGGSKGGGKPWREHHPY